MLASKPQLVSTSTQAEKINSRQWTCFDLFDPKIPAILSMVAEAIADKDGTAGKNRVNK